MVLIAAAVCTKGGKTMFSRQFVEMPKARIEGLLAAFPKLMTAGKQHTFVETDSVRYVYQPMEKFYMLLITTKASNILEDLETLRLFSKVIPEYCRSMEEKEILDNAFNLIFAFDEIVALGYRESVNLAQIKTFVEMDSHEEKVYQAVRQTQEREAKQKMREKAKELQRQRMESIKKGIPIGTRSYGNSSVGSEGFGSTVISSNMHTPAVSVPDAKSFSKSIPSRNALKLGGKNKDVDSFVDQLKTEGEYITNVTLASTLASGSEIAKYAKQNITLTEGVHLRIEDKLVARLGRDGGLQMFELTGILTLRITDEKYGRITILIENADTLGLQLQTHPNVDKELFKNSSQIGLKNPTKPFPLNNDVGVLKWRWQTQAESAVPLTINCWPSENGEGGCDVNIEYELVHTKLELQNVNILIPMPSHMQPTVVSCEGDYNYDARKNLLQWSHTVIDASNSTGSIEFTVPSSIPADFFPVQLSFTSKVPYADIQAKAVHSLDSNEPIKFSIETLLYTDKYEIA